MSEQAESGDVGAGMQLFLFRFLAQELLQQGMLAGAHHALGTVQIVGVGSPLHRGSEQHAGAEWTAQQQRITIAGGLVCSIQRCCVSA